MWTPRPKTEGSGKYYLKIDDTYFFKIDDTYKLIIGTEQNIIWTNRTKN